MGAVPAQLVAEADGAVVATMQLSYLGCALVQLTTDKSRGAAHRCYERPGFVPSHEGMKLSF
jgi:hypothetical protein